MAAAKVRREQTVDVRTVEQEEQAKRSFEETLKEVARSAPERHGKQRSMPSKKS